MSVSTHFILPLLALKDVDFVGEEDVNRRDRIIQKIAEETLSRSDLFYVSVERGADGSRVYQDALLFFDSKIDPDESNFALYVGKKDGDKVSFFANNNFFEEGEAFIDSWHRSHVVFDCSREWKERVRSAKKIAEIYTSTSEAYTKLTGGRNMELSGKWMDQAKGVCESICAKLSSDDAVSSKIIDEAKLLIHEINSAIKCKIKEETRKRDMEVLLEEDNRLKKRRRKEEPSSMKGIPDHNL